MPTPAPPETLISLASTALFALLLAAGLALHCLHLVQRLRRQIQLRRAFEQKYLASRAQLEQLTHTDRLTGLRNRLRFEEDALLEIKRAERYGCPLALVCLDLDRFKRINDNHGQRVGDDVLSSIARLIRKNLRQSDAFCRWCGEAFVILLPHTDLDHALQLAEKLRQLVASNQFVVDSRVTASFGVTCLHRGEALGELVSQADQALYRAKQLGRNRIECAQP